MSTAIMKDVLNILLGSEGKYANLLLSSPTLAACPKEKKTIVTALLYTTIENKIKYDYFISALSGRSAKDIDKYTLHLLRLGFCQVLDMSGIPDFAAVNETVALARNKGEKSFVNALLRRASRERNDLPSPDRKKSPKRYLSVKYSCPAELCRFFLSRKRTP